MSHATPESLKGCPFCGGEVPDTAVRCRHCASDLVDVTKHVDLGLLFVAGLVITFVGAGVMSSGGSGYVWGLVIIGVGGIFLEVAVIATGVSIGIRNSADLTRRQRYLKTPAEGELTA